MTDDKRSLADIKRDHPIEDVVTRYTTLHKVGRTLVGLCPFHNDHKPSFTVYPSSGNDPGSWVCWSVCNASGDAIDLVGYAEFRGAWSPRNKDMFLEALAILDGRLPPRKQPVPKEWKDVNRGRPIELEPHVQTLLDVTARLYHTTLLTIGPGINSPYTYLRERGFSDATIRREGIGYATGQLLAPMLASMGLSREMAADINLLDRMRGYREFMAGRIVFVDRDRSGAVIHMIGRTFAPWISAKAPKYLSLKEIDKPLHGYAQLDKRASEVPVVLVESPPDRATARQWGYDAVAEAGGRMKKIHGSQLARMKRPKVLVPHNDATGRETCQKWLDLIGEGEIVELPPDIKDLNELGQRPDGQTIFDDLMTGAGFILPDRTPYRMAFTG